VPSLKDNGSRKCRYTQNPRKRANEKRKVMVIVAIANKLARIAWAVLSSGKDYQHQGLQTMAA